VCISLRFYALFNCRKAWCRLLPGDPQRRKWRFINKTFCYQPHQSKIVVMTISLVTVTTVIIVITIHFVVTIEIVTTTILFCYINKTFCWGNKVIFSVICWGVNSTRLSDLFVYCFAGLSGGRWNQRLEIQPPKMILLNQGVWMDSLKYN